MAVTGHRAGGKDIGGIIAAGGRHHRRRQWLFAAFAVLVIAAVVTYLIVRPHGAAPVETTQSITVASGTLTVTTSLTGTSAAGRQTDLSFDTGGIVTALTVSAGDTVKQGQVLARLDDTDARRALRTAQISLQQAQLKLADLAAPETLAADLASAQQATATAQSQLLNAQQALAALQDPAQTDIDAARQAVLSAETSLSTAEQNLSSLQSPAPSDLSSARLAVASATASLASAQEAVPVALGSLRNAQATYCAALNTPDVCFSQLSAPLPPSMVTELSDLLAVSQGITIPGVASKISALLQANSTYTAALATVQAETSNLTIAQQKLDALTNPTAQQLFQARSVVDAGERALSVAQQKEQTLLHPSAADVAAAQQAVDSARAAVAVAQAHQAQVATSDQNAITQQELAVSQAELQVESAQEAVNALTISAPYDGVVGATSVAVGDRVGGGTAAITVLDPNAVTMGLTVSESDLPKVVAGQLGVATFDALSTQRFIVRVTSIGTVPTVSQGVVTYPVTATVLQGDAVAAAAEQLAGVPGAALARAAAAQELPAPGMSATVTLLLQSKSNVLLVPAIAVHTQANQSYVLVPTANGGSEQRKVTTGLSNGTSVEITSGLTEGETVLVTSGTSVTTSSGTGSQSGSNNLPSGNQPPDFNPGGVR